jgi:hypothetical protein
MTVQEALALGYRGGLPVPAPRPEGYDNYAAYEAARLRHAGVFERKSFDERLTAQMRDRNRLDLLRLESEARLRARPDYRGL